MTPQRVPLVDYLYLDDPPVLQANECVGCAARFFDRRNACASCFGTEFRRVSLEREGVITTFTIVSVAAPGVDVPFVAAVVDCGGTSVRANIVNTPAEPESVKVGMPVQLTTYVIGTDSAGVEAIGFGFEPIGREVVS